MDVRRLSWLGTRTENYRETRDFFADVLGLRLVMEEPGFAMFELPGGEHDYVEVFDANDPDLAFMTTGPVAGFLVDDVVHAREELETAGVELLEPTRWSQRIEGYGWFQFRGPDGNVYGCMQGSRAVVD